MARIRAGNERLIVQFDTEIERFRIHNYRPRVFVILENLADDFVDGECVRAGNLDRTVTGSATAASATAVATSSAAIG